ncbi:MAG TPA: serine hydrolase domain-containing protein [Stellaceae bacterium]|nr:serine hydrolase domain-containing protein [Stellaceae bacterium]
MTISPVKNTSKELLIYRNRRAGYLVEKLSGMGFGEFLRTRLFEPLGMRDTAFWVPSDKTDRFASCYQPGTGAAV